MTKNASVVESLRKAINDSYGDDVIVTANRLVLDRIDTGVFSIDLETGGIPRGRMMILVGEESTGKSTLLYTIAGRAQRVCGNCMSGRIVERITRRKMLLAPGGKAGAYYARKIAGHLRTVYCKGESLIHKEPLKVIQYDIGCTVCKSPTYSTALIVDSEHNYTRDWAERFGVIHHYVALAKPEYSEQVGDIMREALNTGRVSFVGVDSLDAQGPKIEDESSMEDQQMGVQARVWNKITRILHSKLNKRFTYGYKTIDNHEVEERRTADPVVAIVQQWREKIGGYGDTRVMGGGLGKGYAASIIMGLSKGEKDWRSKEDKDLQGLYFNFELRKSKVSRPFRYGRFYFSVDDLLIDNTQTIIDYALKYDVIEKSGAWLSFKGDKWQGRDALAKFLRSDPALTAQLKKNIVRKARRDD